MLNRAWFVILDEKDVIRSGKAYDKAQASLFPSLFASRFASLFASIQLRTWCEVGILVVQSFW